VTIWGLRGQAQLGREAGGQRWGPRPLDLDIIFYEGAHVEEEGLQIPHPRWHERPFVQARLPQEHILSSCVDARSSSGLHARARCVRRG
jgi:2-amino-4-hydroxy-6-hydroxymethyldihydropteridine diphosphokinase/dihydropteroate synthase